MTKPIIHSSNDLAIRMEKIKTDDPGIEKYSVLAYFKEQEKARNNALYAVTNNDVEEQHKPANTTEIIPNSTQTQTDKTIKHITHVQIAGYRFSVTDLILSFIGFFLFILILTKE